MRDALADRGACWWSMTSGRSAAAAAFRATGPHGRVLYTTRDPAVLHGVGAEVVRVDVLPERGRPPTARSLTGETGRRCRPRLTRCSRRPAGSRWRWRWSAPPSAAAAAPGSRSLDELERGARDVPRSPVRRHLQSDAGRDRRARATRRGGVPAASPSTRRTRRSRSPPSRALDPPVGHRRRRKPASGCRRSPRASCSPSRTRRSRFHDLQREFLLLQAEDLALLHADLLAAYRALLPAKDSSWAQLPEDEPYIREHLSTTSAAPATAPPSSRLSPISPTSPSGAFASGPYAAESDLRQAADAVPRHRGRLAGCASSPNGATLFADQPTVGDLAATLWSRTADAPASAQTATAAPAPPTALPRAAVGAAHRPAGAHARARGPHQRGDGGGVLARRRAARQRQRRRDGAALGPRHRPAHRHARRPHRLGERGGVLARRHPARQRQRRRDGAALGPRQRPAHRTLEGHTGG